VKVLGARIVSYLNLDVAVEGKDEIYSPMLIELYVLSKQETIQWMPTLHPCYLMLLLKRQRWFVLILHLV
jgi:hypothetical protein